MTTTTRPEPALYAALSALQADLPTVLKDNRVNAGKMRYTYADLAAVTDKIMPALAAYGLAFIAGTNFDPDTGHQWVWGRLTHKNGAFIESRYLVRGGTPQQAGSEITYYRRYLLCAMTGVATEDDDGASASNRPSQITRKNATATAAESGTDWVKRAETAEYIEEVREVWSKAKQAGAPEPVLAQIAEIASTKPAHPTEETVTEVFEAELIEEGTD